MEIKEVGNEITKKFKGGKGIAIVAVVFVGLFIISYISQSRNDSTEETGKITGVYASYPDSITNANVIISTLEDSIDYAKMDILDAMGDTDDLITENFQYTNELIGDGFASTHEWLEDGFNSMKALEELNTDKILGAIDDIDTGIYGGGAMGSYNTQTGDRNAMANVVGDNNNVANVTGDNNIIGTTNNGNNNLVGITNNGDNNIIGNNNSVDNSTTNVYNETFENEKRLAESFQYETNRLINALKGESKLESIHNPTEDIIHPFNNTKKNMTGNPLYSEVSA